MNVTGRAPQRLNSVRGRIGPPRERREALDFASSCRSRERCDPSVPGFVPAAAVRGAARSTRPPPALRGGRHPAPGETGARRDLVSGGVPEGRAGRGAPAAPVAALGEVLLPPPGTDRGPPRGRLSCPDPGSAQEGHVGGRILRPRRGGRPRRAAEARGEPAPASLGGERRRVLGA